FSRLIAAEVDCDNGEKRTLDDIEIAGFATLLGGAGAETVTKLVGSAVYLFAKFPDQWRKLLDDRGKIPAAVEELLRFEAPSQYQVRRSMRDVHLHGTTIPEGNPVFLINGSANRDGEAWTDPDKFDIDRNRTRETARLHAAIRGGLRQLQPCPHAKRRRLAEHTGEGAAIGGRNEKGG